MNIVTFFFLFTLAVSAYSTPLSVVKLTSITHTENCSSGWDNQKPSFDAYLITKPLNRSFNISLTKESYPSLSVPLIPIRPSSDKISRQAESIKSYSLSTIFTEEGDVNQKLSYDFNVGYSVNFGMLTIKKNTYKFCLLLNIFSPPNFEKPTFTSFPKVLSGSQTQYTYKGEVLVQRNKATQIQVGDLFITITGEL